MDLKIIFLLLFITLCTGSRRHNGRRVLYGKRRPLHSIGSYGGGGGVLFDDDGPSNSIRPPAWDSPIDASQWRPWRPANSQYGLRPLRPGKPRRPRDLREDFNRLQRDKLDRRLSWVSLGLQAVDRLRRRPRTITTILGRPINRLYGGLQSSLSNTLGPTLDPLLSVFQRVPLLQNQLLRPVYNRGDVDGDEDNSDESSSEEADAEASVASSEEGWGRQPWSESDKSSASQTTEEDKSQAAEADGGPDGKKKVDADNRVVAGGSNAGEANRLPGDNEREAPQSEVSEPLSVNLNLT